MIEVKMDMIQTIGMAVVILILGSFLRKKVNFFEKFCIPSPVIGGFIFAITNLFLHELNILFFSFDSTLQSFFMTMFFTSIGFNASFKLLKAGGKKVVIFLMCALGLVILQNVVAIGIGVLLNVNPFLALLTGSTAMTGGHGTSAAMAPIVQNMGILGAKSVAIAAATFGLISGSTFGGPIAKLLIKRKKIVIDLKSDCKKVNKDNESVKETTKELDGDNFARAFFVILFSMFIGSYISNFLNQFLTFPSYIGPMIVAAIIRNIADSTDKVDVHYEEIRIMENISLSVFLGMAMMTLSLWDLRGVAGALIILLLSQVILACLYAYTVTFKMMGSNYDSVVIASGHIGFGLGATPNGIANMQSVCDKYTYSNIAFFVLPIVGALFIDFFNVSIISVFFSFLS